MGTKGSSLKEQSSGVRGHFFYFEDFSNELILELFLVTKTEINFIKCPQTIRTNNNLVFKYVSVFIYKQMD
jgi:hypothetical protein